LIWEAASFTWWRGIYGPAADQLNIIFWYFGWFDRWPCRRGDLIRVHGGPPTVAVDVDHRRLKVYAAGAWHDRVACCDPWEAP
jgi:hypothetical protein